MQSQIPFDLSPAIDFTFDNFVTDEAGRALVDYLKFGVWDSPILLLLGPSGVGKTHLGRAWINSKKSVASVSLSQKQGIAKFRDRYVWIDNAERAGEDKLFILTNMALNGEVRGILMASNLPVSEWGTELPDLRSRLKNVPVMHLKPHNEDVLEPIIRRLFEARGRMVTVDVVHFLMSRTSRSVDAMRALVAELDLAAQSEKKDITKAFVARYLKHRQA